MSGGVGLDERKALKAKEQEFNLKLEFADDSGKYLSEVTVVIYDLKGKEILHTVSSGPWFMLDLSRGKYKIEVIFRGKRKARQVSVDSEPKTILFHWKSDSKVENDK